MRSPGPALLTGRFLDVIEHDIVPMTRAGVAAGNKVFGAAILRKADLSLVVADTNRETANPLFHGEISTLNSYYVLPAEKRPTARDCLFLSTHEPARSAFPRSPGPASTTSPTSSATRTRATLSQFRTISESSRRCSAWRTAAIGARTRSGRAER